MIRGIFETVFPRPTLDESFRAASDAGFEALQFDLASAGVDAWSRAPSGEELNAIGESANRSSLQLAALAGTCNMAHPDPVERESGLDGLRRVIDAASVLEIPFVTLCTGTRDRSSMWRLHQENSTDGAWTDMLEGVRKIVKRAERLGVTLLVEPEPANVASNAHHARRLLDEVTSPRLKIVLDPANIVLSDQTRSPETVLRESFDLLGPDIVFAHAKDLGEEGDFRAAGTGIVPWTLYWELLEGVGYEGAVIYHTLTESDVSTALSIWPGYPA